MKTILDIFFTHYQSLVHKLWPTLGEEATKKQKSFTGYLSDWTVHENCWRQFESDNKFLQRTRSLILENSANRMEKNHTETDTLDQ